MSRPKGPPAPLLHIDDRHGERCRLGEEVSHGLLMLMRRRGKTNTWVAQRLGVKQPRISQILEGSENLTLNTISDFAQALGFGIHIVFDKPGVMKIPEIIDPNPSPPPAKDSQ